MTWGVSSLSSEGQILYQTPYNRAMYLQEDKKSLQQLNCIYALYNYTYLFLSGITRYLAVSTFFLSNIAIWYEMT